jgi:hypothetical protein
VVLNNRAFVSGDHAVKLALPQRTVLTGARIRRRPDPDPVLSANAGDWVAGSPFAQLVLSPLLHRRSDLSWQDPIPARLEKGAAANA